MDVEEFNWEIILSLGFILMSLSDKLLGQFVKFKSFLVILGLKMNISW